VAGTLRWSKPVKRSWGQIRAILGQRIQPTDSRVFSIQAGVSCELRSSAQTGVWADGF
jgi:hypothetical protein